MNKKESKASNFKIIILVIMILILAIVGFVIFKSKGSTQVESELKSIFDAKGVSENVEETYGKTISNYKVEAIPETNWKIFHSDGENIYLISEDYIPVDVIPNSTKDGVSTENKVTPVEDVPKAVTLSNIIDDYEGANSIKDDNPAKKWLNKWFGLDLVKEYDNMKITAYMLDTTAWSSFANEVAEYAIGGPTIEMLFDSYNKRYGTQYQCQIGENAGYQIRKSVESEWVNEEPDMIQEDGLYIKVTPETAVGGTWIASPSNMDIQLNVALNTSGKIRYDFYQDSMSGFRPVVCLKADTKLLQQNNGTYVIQ